MHVEPQEFSISPLLIAGNYLRISLNGRRQRQPGDGLFYTVLQQVDILGFAVSSAVRDQSPTDKMIRAFAAPLFMNHHVNSGKPLRLVDIQKTWDHWKNLLGTANGFDEVEGEYFAVDVRSPLRSLEIFEMLIEAYLRILPNLVRVLDSWIVSGFQFTKQETLSLSRTLIDQGQEQFLISSLMGRDVILYLSDRMTQM